MWANRERGRVTERLLCAFLNHNQHVRWQTWTLIAFRCVRCKVCLQVLDGLAETSSASSINTFPWQGVSSGLRMNPRQWSTHRDLGTRNDSSGRVYCKSLSVYFCKEVVEQWGGVPFEGQGPTKRPRDKWDNKPKRRQNMASLKLVFHFKLKV